jgi:extracellular elastinolytic metalloproteinase
MRRSLPLLVALCLLLGALVGPAEAAKKKKKKKKKPPVTFTTTGSFAAMNPATLEGAGVTQNEFLAACSIPASQGVDGFVIELPAKVSKVTSTVNLTGGDATGIYDLDMYFYDESCASKGAASSAGTDELGAMPSGVKYVVVSAFWGVQVNFNFESVELR